MTLYSYVGEGERGGLRSYRIADGPEFTARVRESRDLHRPWLFPPATIEEYEAYAARLTEGDARAGFLVCELGTGALAGFVNVNNIVRGAFRCGALGYGAFAHAAGRGLLREALGLVLDHAFAPTRSAWARRPTDRRPATAGPAGHRARTLPLPAHTANNRHHRGAGSRRMRGCAPWYCSMPRPTSVCGRPRPGPSPVSTSSRAPCASRAC
ncbi:GNAT family N-acetyltransferase [Streptomyces yangpuensis]|uniref:GNAT family N-acetyltransferase n=1 Tax=Streptomyces yangpuensis TaxID=1648182 RepID=UPI000AF5F808|nr:GNAT family N-acetyltransferase [Streptomyces yangpuensis]